MNLNISSMNSGLVLTSLLVTAALASEFDEARLVFRGEEGEEAGEGQPRPRQFRFSDPVRLGRTTGNMANSTGRIFMSLKAKSHL